MARNNVPLRLPASLIADLEEEQAYVSSRNPDVKVTRTYVIESLLKEALQARQNSRANTDLTFVTRNLRYDN